MPQCSRPSSIPPGSCPQPLRRYSKHSERRTGARPKVADVGAAPPVAIQPPAQALNVLPQLGQLLRLDRLLRGRARGGAVVDGVEGRRAAGRHEAGGGAAGGRSAQPGRSAMPARTRNPEQQRRQRRHRGWQGQQRRGRRRRSPLSPSCPASAPCRACRAKAAPGIARPARQGKGKGWAAAVGRRRRAGEAAAGAGRPPRLAGCCSRPSLGRARSAMDALGRQPGASGGGGRRRRGGAPCLCSCPRRPQAPAGALLSCATVVCSLSTVSQKPHGPQPSLQAIPPLPV